MATLYGKQRGGLTAGTASEDSILGLAGNDILRGRSGDDVLSGGAGSDTFVFESTRARNGFDTIRDYSWSAARNGAKDILDLSGVLDRVGGGDSSRESINGHVWLVEGDKGAYLYIDRDGLGGSAVAQTWALLEGVHAGDPVRVHLAHGPDYTLTVREGPRLSYDATTFTEADANDGSIADKLTITLVHDAFTGANGQAIAGAVVTHVPEGLTAVITRTSEATAELSFTGNAEHHLHADDIADLTVTFGDAAFASGDAAKVIGNTRTDLAIDFANPDPLTVVVFDLVDGWSSNHSGRAFQADTHYTIYIRVDSDSAVVNTVPGDGAPDGADWGMWTGASRLGADDKVILVGNAPGSGVLGSSGGSVNAVFYTEWSHSITTSGGGGSTTTNGGGGGSTTTTGGGGGSTTTGFRAWPSRLLSRQAALLSIGGTFSWYNAALNSYAARLMNAGTFWRLQGKNNNPPVDLWTGTRTAASPGGNLSEHYRTVIPVGILTSQAALVP